MRISTPIRPTKLAALLAPRSPGVLAFVLGGSFRLFFSPRPQSAPRVSLAGPCVEATLIAAVTFDDRDIFSRFQRRQADGLRVFPQPAFCPTLLPRCHLGVLTARGTPCLLQAAILSSASPASLLRRGFARVIF